MNAAHGSSRLFRSIFRSKYIVHNTYTGRRSNLRSKPTPIYGPVHKYDLNFSYSRSHFSWLPQAVSKGIIYSLSCQVVFSSLMIVPVINSFDPNEDKCSFHICDNSITTFSIIGL